MSKRDYGDGGIDERGPNRYRLRWHVDGKRFSKSFRGSISDARKELRRLIKSVDDGLHVAPDKLTLATWVDRWIALLRLGDDTGKKKRGLVNARTLERYEELLRLHVIPTLGKCPLQRLAATEIDTLYTELEKKLATRTVHHVHIVFKACLSAAVRKGLLVVIPVSKAEAPVPDDSETGQVLDQEQLAALLRGFRDFAIYPIVAIAAFTGARRMKFWRCDGRIFDPGAKILRITRSLEETKAHGRRFKEPKTRRGNRTIAIDDGLAALLSAEQQKYLRLAAGVAEGADVDLSLVKLPEGALIFPAPPADAGDFDFTRPRETLGISLRYSPDGRRKSAFRSSGSMTSVAHTKPYSWTLAPRFTLSPCDAAMTRQSYSAFMLSGRKRPTQAQRP